eukprot:6175402-Pleurochrysis_carterae.AAC.1
MSKLVYAQDTTSKTCKTQQAQSAPGQTRALAVHRCVRWEAASNGASGPPAAHLLDLGGGDGGGRLERLLESLLLRLFLRSKRARRRT